MSTWGVWNGAPLKLQVAQKWMDICLMNHRNSLTILSTKRQWLHSHCRFLLWNCSDCEWRTSVHHFQDGYDRSWNLSLVFYDSRSSIFQNYYSWEKWIIIFFFFNCTILVHTSEIKVWQMYPACKNLASWAFILNGCEHWVPKEKKIQIQYLINNIYKQHFYVAQSRWKKKLFSGHFNCLDRLWHHW